MNPEITIATVQDIENLKSWIDIKLSQLQTSGQSKWLRSKDVCKMLGISLSCLQNMRNTGALPYSKIEGTYFYKLSEIEAILEENSSKN